MNYTLPKDKKGLRALTTAAIESATTTKTKIQIASVAILHHAYQHGDYSEANYLVEELGHGIKRDSLVEWFKKFGGLTVGDKPSDGFTGWSGKEYIKENFNQAKETMWYEEKKANAFVGFNLQEKLDSVLNQYNKKIKEAQSKGKEDQVILDVKEDTLRALLALGGFDQIIEDSDSVSVEDQLKAHYEKENQKAA